MHLSNDVFRSQQFQKYVSYEALFLKKIFKILLLHRSCCFKVFLKEIISINSLFLYWTLPLRSRINSLALYTPLRKYFQGVWNTNLSQKWVQVKWDICLKSIWCEKRTVRMHILFKGINPLVPGVHWKVTYLNKPQLQVCLSMCDLLVDIRH